MAFPFLLRFALEWLSFGSASASPLHTTLAHLCDTTSARCAIWTGWVRWTRNGLVVDRDGDFRRMLNYWRVKVDIGVGFGYFFFFLHLCLLLPGFIFSSCDCLVLSMLALRLSLRKIQAGSIKSNHNIHKILLSTKIFLQWWLRTVPLAKVLIAKDVHKDRKDLY